MKEALKKHLEPLANPAFERFIFRQARQDTEESLDQFCTRLRSLVVSCEFTNEGDEIRGQLIPGCASTKLRERILEEPRKPLADILTLGRSK